MRANTARKYARRMARIFPQFHWSVIRMGACDWVVSGTDGIFTKHYNMLDCAINS